MITEVCNNVRNWFATDVIQGSFTISGGSISPLDFMQEGQYFRIIGSVFNDGVYQYPTAELHDETFVGEVWLMAVPSDFLALCSQIESYVEVAEKNLSPFTSESFGGYSYTKAVDKDGAAMSWQKAYGKQLNRWRKI